MAPQPTPVRKIVISRIRPQFLDNRLWGIRIIKGGACEGEAQFEKVGMGIDESRDDGVSSGIKTRRIREALEDLGGRPNGLKPAVLHSEGFGHRDLVINRIDLSVVNDQVSRLGRHEDR